MNLIHKVLMATAGATFLTMGARLAPVQAALLKFDFTTTDLYQSGSILTQTGSFNLDTETKTISDIAGVFNIPGNVLLISAFNVSKCASKNLITCSEKNDTVLSVSAVNCQQEELIIVDGKVVGCFATGTRTYQLGLEFSRQDLLNQLSNNPSVYTDSFVPGSRPGLIGTNGENFFEVTGSTLAQLFLSSGLPSPVTTLEVERVETVPEPTNTAAVLAISTLGAVSVLKRCQKLTATTPRR